MNRKESTMSENDRRSPQGYLLGPKNQSDYATWRRNRDKQIANPRRLKTCKDEKPAEPPSKS